MIPCIIIVPRKGARESLKAVAPRSKSSRRAQDARAPIRARSEREPRTARAVTAGSLEQAPGRTRAESEKV